MLATNKGIETSAAANRQRLAGGLTSKQAHGPNQASPLLDIRSKYKLKYSLLALEFFSNVNSIFYPVVIR